MISEQQFFSVTEKFRNLKSSLMNMEITLLTKGSSVVANMYVLAHTQTYACILLGDFYMHSQIVTADYLEGRNPHPFLQKKVSSNKVLTGE